MEVGVLAASAPLQSQSADGAHVSPLTWLQVRNYRYPMMPEAQITASAAPYEAAASPPRSRLRANGLVVARVLASAILLGLVLWWVEWATVLEVLRGANSMLLLIVLGVFFIERGLSAYRWHVLIRTQTRSIGYGTTLKVTFLSNFLGNFLPGSIGLEAVRIAGLARSTSDLAGAFSTVLVDRVLGFIALMAIILVVLPFAPADAAATVMIWGGALLIVLAVGFALLPLLARTPKRMWMVPARMVNILRSKLLKVLRSLRAMKRWPGTLVWAMTLAVAFQFVRIIIAPLIALALGLDIPLVYFFLYVPIIVFLMMLPFSVGGLGVREAGFVYFFGAALTTPEAAFAISIIIYIMGIISCLPGAAVLAAGLQKGGEDTT